LKKINFLFLLLIVSAMLACGGNGGSGTSTPLGASGTSTQPGAIHWQQVNTPPGAIHVNFVDFAANGHWFIADMALGFYRSTDQGATWTQINTGLSTTFGWTINVNPGNGELIASTFSSGGANAYPVRFYRSNDEGNSWAAIPYSGLSSATARTGCVFAANNNLVCGGFWAPFPASGAWFSIDGGQTVTAATTTSTNSGTVYALALNPTTTDLWMGTEQNGIFRSTDNGATWTVESPADTNVDPVHGIRDGNIYGITFDRGGNVLFGSQGGMWKSTPAGSGFNWTNVKNNSNTADGEALGRDANGTLYYGHRLDTKDPTVVYCSTDDGNTWVACDSGLPQFKQANRLVVNPADGRLYAVVRDEAPSQGVLYRTVNPVQ
jgi:hypothetical protein